MKQMMKAQSMQTRMFFPDLGDIKSWRFVGYGDAGFKSLPDKLSSVGGHVVLLVNEDKATACTLNWRSKKLQRKVASSMAAEGLAMVQTIGVMVYNKAILRQIYGPQVDDIPVIIFTDSCNLSRNVISTSMVDDEWLIVDIAMIKDALKDGTVTEIRRVSHADMLADCLTKTGASSDKLLEVLQTGKYELPRGLQSDDA